MGGRSQGPGCSSDPSWEVRAPGGEGDKKHCKVVKIRLQTSRERRNT